MTKTFKQIAEEAIDMMEQYKEDLRSWTTLDEDLDTASENLAKEYKDLVGKETSIYEL